jgi:hypothetical protein
MKEAADLSETSVHIYKTTCTLSQKTDVFVKLYYNFELIFSPSNEKQSNFICTAYSNWPG